MYKGGELATQRLDMIVDGKVIVETKSTLDLHKGAGRQVYNYLNATSPEVGMLLHFGPVPPFTAKSAATQRQNQPNPLNPPNLMNLP